mgnify:FL=1
MILKKEIDLSEYLGNEENFWSGAKDRIEEWKYNDEIIDYLASYIEDVFYDYDKGEVVVEETELNDFIWFDADYILEEARISIE